MNVSTHSEQPIAEWRPGVRTRLKAAASLGSSHLCVIEQWVERGAGAPAHRHPGVEEVVSVLSGRAEFWVEGEEAVVDAQASVVIPAGSRHGFRNVGQGTLHVLAVLSAAAPETIYEAEPDVVLAIGGTDGVELDPTRVRRAAGGDQ